MQDEVGKLVGVQGAQGGCFVLEGGGGYGGQRKRERLLAAAVNGEGEAKERRRAWPVAEKRGGEREGVGD